MTNIAPKYADTKILKNKDIQILCGVGDKKASQVLADIKETYNVKDVLFLHFKRFYAINS